MVVADRVGDGSGGVLSIGLATQVSSPRPADPLFLDPPLWLDLQTVVVRGAGAIPGPGGHLEEDGPPGTMLSNLTSWL